VQWVVDAAAVCDPAMLMSSITALPLIAQKAKMDRQDQRAGPPMEPLSRAGEGDVDGLAPMACCARVAIGPWRRRPRDSVIVSGFDAIREMVCDRQPSTTPPGGWFAVIVQRGTV
jgi:hypothetical protein